MYEIKEYTTKISGFLTLEVDGRRVCDFFPFAKGADPAWVREEAHRIAKVMNMLGDAVEMPPIGDSRPALPST